MTPSNRRIARVARGLPPDGSSANVSRPKRFWRALRTALAFALVAGSSVGMAWGARKHVMTSPRFAIAEVDVIGNRCRPREAVVAESGVVAGTNVFALDLDAARTRLLVDPWIADAMLSRRLPGTVIVQIVERKAAAVVAMGDTFLTTSEGEPFKKLEPDDPVDLPLVTGLAAESIADDREGTMRTIRRAIDLAAEYDHTPLAKRIPPRRRTGGDGIRHGLTAVSSKARPGGAGGRRARPARHESGRRPAGQRVPPGARRRSNALRYRGTQKIWPFFAAYAIPGAR